MLRDSQLQTARTEALELILEGGLRPEAWNQFLDHLCHAVGGTSGALAIRARQSGLELLDPVAATWPDEALAAYFVHDRECDPVAIEITRNIFRVRNGPSFVTQELIDGGEFRKSPFFNEFAVRYDIPYLVGTAFDIGSSHFGVLMIYREDGVAAFDTSARRYLESLTRPLQLGLDTRRRLHKTSVVQGIVSRLDIPVVALDQCARIDYANPAAERLLRGGNPIRVSQERICTNKRTTTDKLHALCLDAVRGHIPKRGHELLLDRPGQHPLRLLILPLSDSLSDSLWGGDVPAAIFFFDDADDNTTQNVAKILCTSYGCTPAEAKNAILYARGATTPQVAQQLGVSQETVKTHLKNARMKTSTNNKAELAQLIEKLKVPLRR